jgi:hypothetical protein
MDRNPARIPCRIRFVFTLVPSWLWIEENPAFRTGPLGSILPVHPNLQRSSKKGTDYFFIGHQGHSLTETGQAPFRKAENEPVPSPIVNLLGIPFSVALPPTV